MSNKDYFDHVQAFSQKMHGQTMSDQEILREFSLSGRERQIAILTHIESMEDPGEITRGDLRKASNRMNLKRQMNHILHVNRLAGK
jgi:hypothetical protein